MNEAAQIKVAFRARLGRFALDAAFNVPARGITALFGPSGCGKTTVLRCVAGLTRLPDGYCAIGGEIWQDKDQFRPPHRRAIGYVFQEASLFPHLSVRQNLLYGAPRNGSGTIHFDETVDLLGLASMLDRAPHHLSGGERQRVAIGRALLSDPRLLLMDEPLSALDRLTKDEILPFIERLHQQVSLPILYVSHDIGEVERLADHLVLMREGRVIAAGPLAEIQSNPALPLAVSREAAVSLEVVVETYDAQFGLIALRLGGEQLLVPSAPAPAGERRRLRIGAGDISLTLEKPARSSILNILPARILSLAPVGEHEVLIVLAVGEGGPRLLARLTSRSVELLGLREGLAVHAQIKGVSIAAR